MTECICEDRDAYLCPVCPTHEPDAYRKWLTEKAPRVAAAEADGDLFLARLLGQYPLPGAADIPEFADFRAALSDPARRLFDGNWARATDSEYWPRAYEVALMIRDDWRPLALAQERDVLREVIADMAGLETALFAERCSSGYEFDQFQDAVLDCDGLEDAADDLAALITVATELEAMLRAHAANTVAPAADA